jgi:Domain of unknown function (DUF4956)
MLDMGFSLTLDFFIRFAINSVSLFVLLRLIHYRNAMQRGSLGGFLLFGNGIFIVTALLYNVEMSMGFAFGLFAVFAMLRYRTEALSTVEMAYLFVSIAISLMSAVSQLNFLELILVNGMMCALAVFCESSILATKTLEKNIVYENIELIHPGRMEELREDLQRRTGLKIDRIEVGDVDFLRDIASLKVYYSQNGGKA